MSLAGIGFLALTLFQVRFGLFPLAKVEKGLTAIRSGDATRLDVGLPPEIRPLQQELNALLKSNQEIVERARTHVGNLAHALKTPLAVIRNEARDDQSPLARKVTEQADIMTDQVNLYLDRARMAARVGVIGRVTEVRPVSESIIRALERIYHDKQLSFSTDCPPGTRFQGERQDLEEMLGNLLDNASKWARSKVHAGRRARCPMPATAPGTGSRSASTTTGPASRPSRWPTPSSAAGGSTRPSRAPASAIPSSPTSPTPTAASWSSPAPSTAACPRG